MESPFTDNILLLSSVVPSLHDVPTVEGPLLPLRRGRHLLLGEDQQSRPADHRSALRGDWSGGCHTADALL